MAADTPSVTPTSSSSTVKSGSPNISGSNQVKPVGLSNLTIEQAPQQLTTGDQPITIEGTVIYSNQETGEIRISTAAGEITVNSNENIPHGTKVLLKLHPSQEQMLVDIIVVEETSIAVKEDVTINEIKNTEIPLLKEGQKLSAALIEPPKQNDLEVLLNDLNSITKEEILKLDLPLDKNIINEIIANYDIKNVLTTLPEAKFNEVISILVSHINTTKLKSQHPNIQHKLQTAYKTEQPTTTPQPTTSTTTVEDQDILQALYTPATETKAAAPVTTTDIEQTLSIQENIQTKTLKSSMPSQPTEQKYSIDIIKVIPANITPEKMQEVMSAAVQKTHTEAAKYHTPEYNAIPLKIATLDIHKHKGLNVLKTINQETPLDTQKVERFAIEQSVTISEKSIVIFKATPLNEGTITAPQGGAAAIAAATQSEILDKTFITREKWPALDETIKVLNEVAPQAAQNIKNTMLSPTAKVIPTTLFILAALRLGNVENWIGGNVLKELRNAGRRELADKLTNDFTRMSNLSKEPIADEWRPFSLPFIHDEQLSQIQMYIRDEEQNNEDGAREKSTRFILNLNLSRIGQMQLDGNTNKKTLDLIIRSEEPLPFEIRQEIMKSFTSGIEQVNMQGNISFQTKAQEWIEINIPDDDAVRV